MSKTAAIALLTMLALCQGCTNEIREGKTTVWMPKLPENATAQQIREANVKAGIYKSVDQLSWLTDEFIANHRKQAQEVTSEMADVERGRVHVITTYAGNHFYADTAPNGQPRWNWWTGDPGNAACGKKYAKFCYAAWYSTYVQSDFQCKEGYYYYGITP